PMRIRSARPTGGAWSSVTAIADRLQILVYPSLDPIERFLDVLDGISHAEAQIAFTEIAKGSAGERGDASVIQKRVRKFLRWPAGLRDVWENVKRAMRQAAGETFNFVETADHHVASFLELVTHCIDRFLWPAQRFDARNLAEARGARARVRHQS